MRGGVVGIRCLSAGNRDGGILGLLIAVTGSFQLRNHRLCMDWLRLSRIALSKFGAWPMGLVGDHVGHLTKAYLGRFADNKVIQ